MQRLLFVGMLLAGLVVAPAARAVDVCSYSVRFVIGTFCPVHTGDVVCLSQSAAIGPCQERIACYGGQGFFCQAALEPLSGPQNKCPFRSIRPTGMSCFRPIKPGQTGTPTATGSPEAPTFTPTFTQAPTASSTIAPTVTRTATSTATASPVSTATETLSPTGTPTGTATATLTAVATATATSLPTATGTNTAGATSTSTPPSTATNTSIAGATSTATPLSTATRTNTASATSTATPPSTATNTNTVATSTATPPSTATNTSIAGATSTATPPSTATRTNTATATRTATPPSTATSTNTVVATSTATPPSTATNTSTSGATSTATPPSTATRTNTASPTSTATPPSTATNTNTVGATSTATPPSTATRTNTASATSTATPPSTATRTNTASPTSTATPPSTATNTNTVATSTATPPSTATRTGTASATRTATATTTTTGTATATPFNIGAHTCTLATAPLLCVGGGFAGLPCSVSPDCDDGVLPPGVCATAQSKLDLRIAASAFQLPAAGSVIVTCGSVGAGGTAACDCNVNSFDPITIPGIGLVCINPVAGCASGVIDCDGGTPVGVNMQADHNITQAGPSCTSNAGCSTQCDTFCAAKGAGFAQISSGCEGFCLGGTNDDNACTMDTQCPGGSCVGGDPVAHAGKCGCSCAAMGQGAPSAAGGLSCNLGVQINVVVGAGTCASPPTIQLEPLCGPLSSESASSRLFHSNNTMANIPGPAALLQTGASVSCNALATSTTTGLRLVGGLGFFDSTLGDILSAQTLVCQ